MIKEGSFLRKYGIQLGLALGQQTDPHSETSAIAVD